MNDVKRLIILTALFTAIITTVIMLIADNLTSQHYKDFQVATEKFSH